MKNLALCIILACSILSQAIGQTIPSDQSWKAFAGSLIGSAVVLGLETLIIRYPSMGNKSFYLIFPTYALGAFVIIPIVSALTFNVLSGAGEPSASGALLNINKGIFSINAPLPIVYPNPIMGGKICTQISLLRIGF